MGRLAPHLANLLTGLRVLLTPIFAVVVWWAQEAPLLGVTAVAIFAVVASTDVWDGRVARRFGSAGDTGRRFDHVADIAFLLVAFSTYVGLGVVPWWVPAAAATAFAAYVADSAIVPDARLLPDAAARLGHLGGVCNYVLVGVLVCNTTAGIDLLPPELLMGLFGLVPVYSAAAVLARLLKRRKAALLGAARSK